jgi:osmotically inducible lipoprotein OsmB
MNTPHTIAPRQRRSHKFQVVAALALSLGLVACAGMSEQDKNTAIGAGVGAVSGSVLTGGGTLGTLGGAAIGGVIGSQIEEKK